MTNAVQVARGDVLLLIGTRKGAFLLSSDGSRKDWSLSGPHWAGSDVFHAAYDPRDGAILAAINNPIWGAGIRRSGDLGTTWNEPAEGPRFKSSDGEAVKRVWHLEPGPSTEPEVIYAGVEPAALFKSVDSGTTWA